MNVERPREEFSVLFQAFFLALEDCSRCKGEIRFVSVLFRLFCNNSRRDR